MKNKNILLITIFTLLMLLVVSCSGESTNASVSNEELPAAEVITQNNTADDAQTGTIGRNASGEFGSSQLIMGMFQLENTEYAISAEQAVQLVPLWKVYENMIASSTAAEAEREALLNQIAGEMTEEQIAFLDSGEVDAVEMQALMADLGIEIQNPGMGSNGNGEGLTDAQREEMQALRETMGDGEGGPGGGMGGGMGQDMDPEQLATLQAERAENGGGIRGGGQMDTLLLPALIEMLESKL